MTLHIGDSVRITSGKFIGETGTVMRILQNGLTFDIGVQLDKPHHQCHTLGGYIPKKRGWWYPENALTLTRRQVPIGIEDLI